MGCETKAQAAICSIEGAVNRIKKIKRQLYGRAGFALLRKTILLQ
ncbi:hypothetical protein [Streptomyces sp. NPDC085540]